MKIKLALLGAAATFAATSAHAQVADTWTINSSGQALEVTAANNANVSLNNADSTTGTAGANILGDTAYKNSVSGAAIGSSASVGFTATTNTDGNSLQAIITGENPAAVTSTNAANVLNQGDISDAVIESGASNSISRVALGASGSVSASVTNLSGENTFEYDVPAVAVAVTNDLNANDENTTVFTGATITTGADLGGNSNSISAAAIGSSASVGGSILQIDGTVNGTFLFDSTFDAAGAPVDPGDTTIESTNKASVVLGAAGFDSTGLDALDIGSATPDQSNITATIADSTASSSVSTAAIGASASASYSSTVYAGEQTNTVRFGANEAGDTVGTFGITATNGADGSTTYVVNNTDITDSTIGADGSNNSISVAGIGSSASFGVSVNDYTGGGNAIVNTVSATAPTIGSTNFAEVAVLSTLTGPTISGGVSNSIASTALGASASQSFSLFTK